MLLAGRPASAAGLLPARYYCRVQAVSCKRARVRGDKDKDKNWDLKSGREIFSAMANAHTPIPALKLNDGNSIPMVSQLFLICCVWVQ